jgi:hypothetical protein
MSEDKFCWKFGTYDDFPIRCKVVKETEKQVKALEPRWDKNGWRERPATITKGHDCFMTYEEALVAMDRYTNDKIASHEKSIKSLVKNHTDFMKNKGM